MTANDMSFWYSIVVVPIPKKHITNIQLGSQTQKRPQPFAITSGFEWICEKKYAAKLIGSEKGISLKCWS